MTLEPSTRRRFLAALTLAVSPGAAGERAAAEAAIGRLVAAHAPAFRAMLMEPPPRLEQAATGWRDMAARCLRRDHLLSSWERDFLRNIAVAPRVSARQREVLVEIAARVAEGARTA